MDDARRIELARTYLELSNAHDLEAIFAMFSDDAVYESRNVGAHEGRAAIESMMRAFFAARPDIYWEVAEYRPIDGGGVEFEFLARHADPDSGEWTERRGRERLYFDDDGRLTRVEVG
ncbi:MAG: nuclear transport factor 2 family protein [Planctomycetota bacterium]